MKRRRHLVIPDTQVQPGMNLDYLWHIGKYIVDLQPDVIIQLGDHADMPSLSAYDKGTTRIEGKRVHLDIAAAQEGLEAMTDPLIKRNKALLRMKKKQFWPEKHILYGNHCYRIVKHVQANPELEGLLSLDDLEYREIGWEPHDFLEVVEIDGILYSHFFPRGPRGYITQTRNGAPSARIQLMREHQSCTAGHQQGCQYDMLPTSNKILHGIIAGSCYPGDFDYLSPQGTTYWRGVIVKNDVHEGNYCPMFIDLDYLKRRYG